MIEDRDFFLKSIFKVNRYLVRFLILFIKDIKSNSMLLYINNKEN